MTKFPYMPLYIDRLVADTEHLTSAEFGSYVLLLCAMWLHGGELPDDSRVLQRICRCTDNRTWSRLYKKLDLFLIHEGGKVTQKRLKETLASTHLRAHLSRQAAESRWQKHHKPLENKKQGDAGAYAGAHADAYAETMPRALAREPETETPPKGAVSGSPLPPKVANSQAAARSPAIGGHSLATPPASANGAHPPKRSEWDLPPAPGPRGQTAFLKRFEAFKSGDAEALNPLSGVPMAETTKRAEDDENPDFGGLA